MRSRAKLLHMAIPRVVVRAHHAEDFDDIHGTSSQWEHRAMPVLDDWEKRRALPPWL